MVKNLLDSKNYDDREKRKKGKIKNVTGYPFQFIRQLTECNV